MDQLPVDLFDPINDYVTAELNRRSVDISFIIYRIKFNRI